MIKNSIKREQSESRLSFLSNVRILREVNKSIFLLAAVVAMCFTSCEDYDHDIADINDRLDLIEGTSLTTIDQQIATINGSIKDLKAVDAELNGYIDALEDDVEKLQTELDETNAALEALKTTNDAQQNEINALKDAKTALEGDIATINSTIATITGQLNTINTKIASLETAVAACASQADVDDIKTALQNVQNDITEIKTDITHLQVRMATVESNIDALQNDVKDLEGRIEKLEELFDQIQSVTFIPEYSDGKVKMDNATKQTSLDFMINPQRLNTDLANAWSGNNDIIKAYVRYTSDPTTRSTTTPVLLSISTVTASDGGMLNIVVKDDETTSKLSNEFWNNGQEAVIYIVISNGVTEIASDAIPMIAYSYASAGGVTANGFNEQSLPDNDANATDN